jgi:uncharacterized protein YcbK (DUF882 family)
MIWSRRRMLQAGGALAGVSAAGLLVRTARGASAVGAESASARAEAGHAEGVHGTDAPRRIALVNLHTDERLEIEFFRDGAYLPEALSAIEGLLRDFRTGERHAMDPELMSYLVQVAHAADAEPNFSVISGYRSPQTNAQLRERSSEVAKHSLHMEGRAIDVRMTRIDCASLAAHAVDLKRGGVGYYRASDFVHLDTGPFRTWKG